eukprot:COSAG02_NODE_13959_length_1327_cov_0.823290_3_plen_53_part_01
MVSGVISDHAGAMPSIAEQFLQAHCGIKLHSRASAGAPYPSDSEQTRGCSGHE